MKTLNNELIRTLDLSYDPSSIGIPDGETLSVVDWVKKYKGNVKRKDDILWILCRKEFMSDSDMKSFAVWCARSTKEHPSYPKGVAASLSDMVADKEAVFHSNTACIWADVFTAEYAACCAYGAAGAAARFAEAVGIDLVSWVDDQIDQLLSYF
jgi:hypothetical protein